MRGPTLTSPDAVAMTLRVKKILHMEQSVYQDVLVFESTDHVRRASAVRVPLVKLNLVSLQGNVLVLDGAIQVSYSSAVYSQKGC